MLDVVHVAQRLRDADREEAVAMCDLEPKSAVVLTYDTSFRSWVFRHDGEPVAVMGLCLESVLGEVGVPWLVGTNRISECKKGFHRASKVVLGRMLTVKSRLENYVDARNVASVEWLERLGFAIHPPIEFGPKKMPFHKFTMEKPNVP